MKKDNNFKNMIQNFRGMKRRYQNPKANYRQVTEFFMDNLMEAYDINDAHLNSVAIKAYDEVKDVLMIQLYSKSSKHDPKQVKRILILLQAYMESFCLQACRLYD